jgi:transcriptional regulator GlxA family with amidase domain
VVLVVFDGVQMLDVAGPADVLDAANRAIGEPVYQLMTASVDGAAVRCSNGMVIGPDAALREVRPRGLDTLLVGGAFLPQSDIASHASNAVMISELQRLSGAARRTCGVCTGAFLLAAAGLLDGRTVTTHWAFSAPLAGSFPALTVEPDRIFIRDGSVVTSAGVTAGIDLALALVEEDHGAAVARTVARWLVTFVQRPGGQSQFSERLAAPIAEGSTLRVILDEIVADPAADHRQAELARRASLSERHLRRVFAQQTNTTPARFVERVRVEHARELLEGSGLGADQIAARAGFGCEETMRRAFIRVLGVVPSEYRARFRSTAYSSMPTALSASSRSG